MFPSARAARSLPPGLALTMTITTTGREIAAQGLARAA
jgi:hypothetical protein